jgi:hypothetical protein
MTSGRVKYQVMSTSINVESPRKKAKPSHVADGDDVEQDGGEQTHRVGGQHRAPG